MNCVFTVGGKKICFYFTKSIDERNGGDTILHVGFWLFFFFFFCSLFFSKRKRARVEKIGTWQKWISVAILNSAAPEPEHRAQSSTTASHSLCLSSCWKDSVSVQGTHTSVDLHWIQICLCENSIGQRYPSQPAMGTEKEPGRWVLTACWWNVLFDFPVTVPVGWEEGPSPHCHVNTTKPWKTATWYWPWLSNIHDSKGSWGQRERERGEKRKRERERLYDIWVWWAYYHVFLNNEMIPPWRCFCACYPLQKIVFPQYVKSLKIN